MADASSSFSVINDVIIVYISVFYNISYSWLLPLDGFKCIFLCRVYCVTVKTKNMGMLLNFMLCYA